MEAESCQNETGLLTERLSAQHSFANVNQFITTGLHFSNRNKR